MTTISNTLFGGPDKAKHILRDALLANIAAVPSNGQICWMCYYFNEPALFDALISAAQRGVRIEIIIDANPRCAGINQQCIDTFKKYPQIKISLAESKPIWEYFGLKWHAHMHSKLYYFSHPTPHVLVGSYNPTAGTDKIKESLIDKIGDHTVSHNVLVNIDDKTLITCLLNYFNLMKFSHNRKWARFNKLNNTSHGTPMWTANYLPNLIKHPINSLFSCNDDVADIKCAISHLKGPNILRPLINASKRGKRVELILDSTHRRISNKQLTQLDQHKIKYLQLTSDKNTLMHNKFIIYKSANEHCVLFGSFNWSKRSWWLNHEIIVGTRNKEIVSAFEARWQEMLTLH